MTKSEQISLLMDEWEQKHLKSNYKRFIRDGIVCEEKWDSQKTPRVCFFLKEAYASEEGGYDLAGTLHEKGPWTMWKKVSIWTQAIHNAFNNTGYEYAENLFRSKEKEVIDLISIINIKKSNGENGSKYKDLENYAKEEGYDLAGELHKSGPWTMWKKVAICPLIEKFVLILS